MKKKIVVMGIILLFTGMLLTPCIASDSTRCEEKTSSGDPLILLEEPGTLSGYVTDTEMHPIQGARIQVDFHDTYQEDYSDATGYYHVIDIPLCYCMKNATCSKPGYIPVLVSLAITENTTYDFILESTGSVLYVGGSGLENYSRIQDAIDNASNGDTVFVYDDSSPYQENIIVDQSISLIGENKNTTVIDGGSVTILILADDVGVSGFTITNSQWLYDIHRTGIYILSNHTYIFNNIITHVWEGVASGWFNRTSNHTFVIQNTIYNVKGPGITFRNTHYGEISYNTINATLGSAIDLWNASVTSIRVNYIQNILDGHGIALWESENCIIINNTIHHGEMQGICLIDSINTSIWHNMIAFMKETGINSDRTASIQYNIIDTCGEYGILASGDHYHIIKNSVCNTSTAIFLSEGRYCYIISNLIKQNEDGLILAGISNSRVCENNFIDNKNDANFSSLIFRFVRVLTCFGTLFQDNYWGNARYLPKIIPGMIYLTKDGGNFTRIPLIKLDMHPAKEPYPI